VIWWARENGSSSSLAAILFLVLARIPFSSLLLSPFYISVGCKEGDREFLFPERGYLRLRQAVDNKTMYRYISIQRNEW
jgi:hypothetical protein